MPTLRLIVALWIALCAHGFAFGQELNAQVNINHKQIQGTDISVFEELKNKITEFLNTTRWTDLQYLPQERIQCTFNLTINKHIIAENSFEAVLIVQSIRPVFQSMYTTTVFGLTDGNFNFEFREHEPLHFRIEQLDNDLTALLAYYAYLLIGLDMDTMSPKGGEAALQQARTIANNASNLVRSAKGWRPFMDHRNRHAIITDYLDGALEPMRILNYRYHREGLDLMAANPDRGRAIITEVLPLLIEAHSNKSLSRLPIIFTDYKRDELVNLYKGKATDTEKRTVVDLLKDLNAAQSTYWNQIKQ